LSLPLSCGGAEQPLFSDRPGALGDVVQSRDGNTHGDTAVGAGDEATRELEKAELPAPPSDGADAPPEPGSDEATTAAPGGALPTPAAGDASPPAPGDGKPPRGPGPRAPGDAGPPPADAPLPRGSHPVAS